MIIEVLISAATEDQVQHYEEDDTMGKEKERGRTGTLASSECQVAIITVSGNEGETSPRAIEALISAAKEDQVQQEAEDDTMGKEKRNRPQSPQTKKKEQGREKTRRNRKTPPRIREGEEISPRPTGDKLRREEAENAKKRSQEQEKKQNFAKGSKKTPNMKKKPMSRGKKKRRAVG